MKKIILSAALLGSVYFVNAQVGIGTPTPATSAMLDITATDKGVLIPRVALTDVNIAAPVVAPVNSLLVFNDNYVAYQAAVGTYGEADYKPEVKGITKGFYYWNVNKWERIVDQSQLDQVISNQGDIAKIKALLDAAYGSNNLGATPSNGTHGGMVYTPAVLGDDPTTGAVETNFVITPAKFEYVKYVVTTPAQGVPGDANYEPAIGEYQKIDATAGLISLIQGNETKTKIETIEGKQFYFAENFVGTVPATIPSQLPGGMYLIDVIEGITNNYNQYLTAYTNIVKTPANGDEGDTNYAPATYYTVEEYTQLLGGNFSYAVEPILQSGTPGNADYQAAIPQGAFYYTKLVELNGVVKPIHTIVDLSTTVLKTIENNSTKIKNILGDNFVNNTTSVFTGDTVKIGETTYYIYKGIFTTKVNANTAVTTGITLDKIAFKILSMNLTYAGGISANTTDITTTDITTTDDPPTNKTSVAFNIGTGKMYTVLGSTDIYAEVIVEFASTVNPLL